MNIERDKYLVKAMGECYTTKPVYFLMGQIRNVPVYNFSTSDGFFKLWNWAQDQEWWDEWIDSTVKGCFTRKDALEMYVHPDRFADEIYSYLKER